MWVIALFVIFSGNEMIFLLLIGSLGLAGLWEYFRMIEKSGAEIRDGELRRVAIGYLDNRLHLLCYIPGADGIRVISFRKTNRREAKLYGKAQTIN